jgi:dipeptidase
MCDTIVVIRPDGGVLFAKNSDRDANEAQFPEWHPAADHPPGSTVQCTHIEIAQVSHTHATLISRPFWMWGAEMGANEHGVVIGNEAVFTNQPYAKTGLTGMDLLRLALERSTSANEAVDKMVDLLEGHGQGGGCGFEDPSFTYHNSFIVADRNGAIVLETAGNKWATEEVPSGVRTISNGLTIPDFARAHRDRLRGRVSGCDIRTALTAKGSAGASGPSDLMRVLRNHGSTRWPRYNLINGTLAMPCMHGGGLIAASSSTAGWVSDLTTGIHWITATSAQCLSLFKPTRVYEPVDIGPLPGRQPDTASLWWRHEIMARRVMMEPERLASLFLEERDSLEAIWELEPPPGQLAFDEGSRLLEEWRERVFGIGPIEDKRPWYARRYWSTRDPDRLWDTSASAPQRYRR